MGQQSIPLDGCIWQTGCSHMMKHLRKNAEIISRRAECPYSAYGPYADKYEKHQGDYNYGRRGRSAARFGAFWRGFFILPAITRDLV